MILVNVLGGRSGGSGSVADVSGKPTQTPARDKQSVVPVQTGQPSAAADASCPALLKALPQDLVGESARRVSSASPYVRAWGQPPVVLICGADRPTGFTSTAGLIQINDVQWYVDTSTADTVVWTAVDRPVFVQVRVPASTDSASVTEITTHISATLPARAPQPNG